MVFQIGGLSSFECLQNVSGIFLPYPDLECVDARSTGIESLPSFISSVQSLKTLKFRYEKFTELPIEIFEMTGLQSLSFE